MKTMPRSQLTKALQPSLPTLLELTPKTTTVSRTVLPLRAWLIPPVARIVSATPASYARISAIVGMAPTIEALIVISIPPLGTEPAEMGLPRGTHAFSTYPRFLTKPRLLTRL
jgi:hypothetical protein